MGSGGMLPRKIFNFRASEMRFPAFSGAIRGFNRTTRTTPRSAPAVVEILGTRFSNFQYFKNNVVYLLNMMQHGKAKEVQRTKICQPSYLIFCFYFRQCHRSIVEFSVECPMNVIIKMVNYFSIKGGKKAV